MIQKLKEYCYRRFRTSFSKSGEDILLGQLLKGIKNGIYIDIGAHHPVKGSISYYFYLRGWTGICVEPNPKFKLLWKKLRKRDHFISKGVGSKEGLLHYFELKDSERNTFSEEYINTYKLNDQIISKSEMEIIPLKSVFENLKMESQISFLSIDCEGFELDILKSNNWKRHRPKFIVLESHNSLVSEDLISEEYLFLISKNYLFVGKTIQGDFVGNLIFRDEFYIS